MDYFDGLNIVMSGNIPHHTGVIVNTPMYYSIQFNYSGSFFLQVGDHKPVYASGAYAFLTYPGEKFSYGTCERNSRRIYVAESDRYTAYIYKFFHEKVGFDCC